MQGYEADVWEPSNMTHTSPHFKWTPAISPTLPSHTKFGSSCIAAAPCTPLQLQAPVRGASSELRSCGVSAHSRRLRFRGVHGTCATVMKQPDLVSPRIPSLSQGWNAKVSRALIKSWASEKRNSELPRGHPCPFELTVQVALGVVDHMAYALSTV